MIVVAAIFMEAILAFQYEYARKQLEVELEHSSLMDLTTSSLHVQEVLSKAEVAVSNHVVHAEQNLDNPAYLTNIITSLLENDYESLTGAFMCFKPNFYPSKGYWYEPYGREAGDSIEIIQLGSEQHDYTHREFFQTIMNGNIAEWSDPYYDPDGAHAWVLSYAIPIHQNGQPIGALGVDLTTEWINDVVNHYHPHPSSFCIVLSGNGALISAPADTTASQ